MSPLLGWTTLAALVYAEALLRKRVGHTEPKPRTRSDYRWVPYALVGLAILVLAIRAPLAAGRTWRNVDEFQYAATASFVRHTGESLYLSPVRLRGLVPLHLLAAGDAGLQVVDAITSVAVALTALLLGLTVWRARGSPLAALLAVPFYALGIAGFEGLTSNAEPYANLFVAAYLLARLGIPEEEGGRIGLRRRVVCGACLGMAAIMKEQLLPYVLLEPAIELAAVLRQPAQPGRARGFARAMALAALGWVLPVALYLTPFVWHGTLGEFLGEMFGFGMTLGDPLARKAAFSPLALLTGLSKGWFALWTAPVGLLGLAYLFRTLLGLPRRAGLPRAGPTAAGIAIVAGVSLLCVAIGFRWFRHYYMLAMLPLSVLASLRVASFLSEFKQRSLWFTSGAMVLLAAFLISVEVEQIATYSTGCFLREPDKTTILQVSQEVERRVPPGTPILVWGWREEIYRFADRPPASRYRAGVPLHIDVGRVLADLDQNRPGVVVLVDPRLDASRSLTRGEGYAFDLDRHPRLQAWLERNGYTKREDVRGFTLLEPSR